MVTVLMRVVSDDLTPVAVDGVTIRVFDESGAFVTEGVTGDFTPGEIEIPLAGSVGGTTYNLYMYKLGYSFQSSPHKQIEVHDPAVPANEFEFVSHEGQTAQTVLFTTKNDLVVPEPVTAVKIWVFDESDDYITEGETDELGELSFALEGSPSPGTMYIVRSRKSGYVLVDGATKTVNVLDPLGIGETNIFDISLHKRDIPESADPLMCRVSGHLIDLSGQVMRDRFLRILPRSGFHDPSTGAMDQFSNPSIIDEKIIVSSATVYSDHNGYIEFSIPRNGMFDVHLEGVEYPSGVIYPVVTPDAAGCNLVDLLFAYVQVAEFATPTVTLIEGEHQDIQVTAALSSGAQMTLAKDITGWLHVTSSDEQVVAASFDEDGEVRVTAISPGSATVSISRNATLVVPRLPSIPALISTPLEVVVTP